MSESIRVPLQVRFGTLRAFERMDALKKNFHLMEIDIIFNAGQFRGRSTLNQELKSERVNVRSSRLKAFLAVPVFARQM